MVMGATVLSAHNPMASELLMVPAVNDGTMVVDDQEMVHVKEVLKCYRTSSTYGERWEQEDVSVLLY